MRTTARRALLLAAALLAPGCAFVHRAVPLDPSGMEYTCDLLADHFEEQVDRTRDGIATLPRKLADHTRECWHHLTTDPRDP